MDATKTYAQTGARETKQFLCKIWQHKEHYKKNELLSNSKLSLEKGAKTKIDIDSHRTALKNSKLEKARP